MSELDMAPIDAVVRRKLRESRTGQVQLKLFRLMDAAHIKPKKGNPLINNTPQAQVVRHLVNNYKCFLFRIGARIHGGSSGGVDPVKIHTLERDDGSKVKVAYSASAIYNIQGVREE